MRGGGGVSGHIARLTVVSIYEQEGAADASDALHNRVHRLREAGTPHKVEGLAVTWDEHPEGDISRRTTIEYRAADQGAFDLGGIAS